MSSSALWLGDPEEKVPLTLFLTAPRDFEGQKCRFCPTQHAFWGKSWGAVKKSVKGTFSSGPPISNAELDIVMSFFENSSVGPSYAAFRTGRIRRDRPKLGNDYVKKGAICACPPKYLLYFYFKFNGDSGSAIKHDLIL